MRYLLISISIFIKSLCVLLVYTINLKLIYLFIKYFNKSL